MIQKPMLAKDGDPANLSYPVLVQPKLDGVRATVQDGRLLSRSLKPIPNLSIRSALENPLYEGLDGELIVGSPTAKDAYRRTCSFVMAPDKTGEPWAFYVFDIIDTDERQFGERYEAAASVVNGGEADLAARMVPTFTAADQSELERIECEALEAGYEGIIARVPNSLYKHGRSGKTGPLLKVKRFSDFEAEVIGVYERMHNANEAFTNELGRTARSTAQAGKVGRGDLGGLVLRAINGPCEGEEFRCGTGFDDEQREAFWYAQKRADEVGPEKARLLDIEPIIGRVAKIKSFPIGVKDAPRFPVFLGWRDLEIDG